MSQKLSVFFLHEISVCRSATTIDDPTINLLYDKRAQSCVLFEFITSFLNDSLSASVCDTPANTQIDLMATNTAHNHRNSL